MPGGPASTLGSARRPEPPGAPQGTLTMPRRSVLVSLPEQVEVIVSLPVQVKSGRSNKWPSPL